MANKIFKSIDEQIEILKSKGLVINDLDKTKDILFRENYFFISGYRHMFMRGNKEKGFIEGTTFEELYAVFVFDRKIRNIMFKYILVIENNIKSIISYQLSLKYHHWKVALLPKHHPNHLLHLLHCLRLHTYYHLIQSGQIPIYGATAFLISVDTLFTPVLASIIS